MISQETLVTAWEVAKNVFAIIGVVMTIWGAGEYVSPQLSIDLSDNPNINQPFAFEFRIANTGKFQIRDIHFDCSYVYVLGKHQKLTTEMIKEIETNTYKPKNLLPSMYAKKKYEEVIRLSSGSVTTMKSSLRTDLTTSEIEEINGALFRVEISYKWGLLGLWPYWNGTLEKYYQLREGIDGFFVTPVAPFS